MTAATAAGWIGPSPVSADCGNFGDLTVHPELGTTIKPVPPGTAEDGPVSGPIHASDDGRVTNPDARPVHQLNCTVIAPTEDTVFNGPLSGAEGALLNVEDYPNHVRPCTDTDPATGALVPCLVTPTGQPRVTDLSLSMSPPDDPVSLGRKLTYTIGVTNQGRDGTDGPSPSDVEVTDLLPQGVRYDSSTTTSGTCFTNPDGYVGCNLGPMPAGATATVTITVVPTQTGEAVNNVSVSSVPLTDPNPSNNQATSTTRVVEAVLQRPVADFDGDRKTDVSVFRPSTGTWFVRRSGGGDTAVQFGAQDDVPVAGDYDGDRRTDLAVFRPSEGVWYVKGSTGAESASQFGTAGDVPVPGDYDGDGRTDLAVYRPSEGVWYLRGSRAGDSAVQFGTVGDIGVPGDYDGDGRTDLAVYRPSEGVWYIRASTTGGDSATRFGTAGDVPVPGDYNGDGRTDLGVFRPSEGVWYQRPSGGGGDTSTQFGTFGDIPVPGTYDSDARTDVAVYRPTEGVWYQLATTAGETSTHFGNPEDLPIPLPSAIRQSRFR